MLLSAAHVRPCSLLLAVAALAASAAFAAPSPGSGKTTYRWVDNQGVVHYGDQIPPEYAGKDREIMNPQGVPVGHVDGEKSPDQLATEARARAAIIKQKQHDTFLVTTYTSVKDIERACGPASARCRRAP
jgi:hypothetical protein